MIIASGTSNRQTKALASSVRETVKGAASVMRTEGEDNGEWIIVDCGAAVAHMMQPAIRQYYNLEEIWGANPGEAQGPRRGQTAQGFGGDAGEGCQASAKAAAKPAAKTSRQESPNQDLGEQGTGRKTAPAKKAPAKKTAKGVSRVVGTRLR